MNKDNEINRDNNRNRDYIKINRDEIYRDNETNRDNEIEIIKIEKII